MLDTPPRPLRVLVLDGQYCHALAAVRSLGQRHCAVEVASHKPHAQAFASRYCAEHHRCPDPNRQRPAYVQWLIERLRGGRYDATLCFEEATADILSSYSGTVKIYTGYAQPERESFLTAARKDRASRLAESLGLAVPRTMRLNSLEDIVEVGDVLQFPMVVKGVSSSGSQQVAVVGSMADLGHAVRRIAALRRDPSLPYPLVQEFIPGEGYGLTALLREGQLVASFMHRRIAEHDVAQGLHLAHGATGAESVDEPEMLQAGRSLLEALHWHGIAMVEFKRDSRTGRFYFIEINPRFVGSLELAIAAGVDLPWLFAQLAAGRPVTGPTRYRVGLKYRWLISKNVADAFERPWGYALGVLECLRPDTRCDLSLRDPRPHLSHLRNAAWWVVQHLRRNAAKPAEVEEMPAQSPVISVPATTGDTNLDPPRS